tara:strand:+ start:173 stop:592 length:420 start_codon:yes stop_codon:yes gene_type:complete
MKIIKNYVIPRPFNGYNIPIAVQSTYLRDYAQRNGFKFSLPNTEISKYGSYSILSGILSDKKDKFTDLAMVSIFILPVFDKKRIYKLFKEKHLQKINLHFALESYVFSVEDLCNWVDENSTLLKITNDFSKLSKFKINQ